MRNPLPNDPLLNALSILTRLQGRPRPKEVLTAGLPLENSRLTPDLFLRAVEREGLRGKRCSMTLSQLPRTILPKLLFLKGGSYCLLDKIGGDGVAHIIRPQILRDVFLPPIQRSVC